MCLLPPVKVEHVDGGVTLGDVLLGLAALRDLLLIEDSLLGLVLGRSL